MLAQAKEATGPNHDSVKLSAFINDEFRDAADLFVVVVVNIEPN